MILEMISFLEIFKIEYTLNVIGPGFDNNENVNPNIFYHGAIHEKKQINAFYESSDILLLTSEREGFPLVVMEAMSFGIVPIVTNVGGLNEEIINCENGFIVDFDEQNTSLRFAEIVKKMTLNNAEFYRISLNSFNHARNNFAKDKLSIKYQDILDQ
jgi:glycosyltransferase involved in cell wall biosynthesis